MAKKKAVRKNAAPKRAAQEKPIVKQTRLETLVDKPTCRKCGEAISTQPTQETTQEYDGKLIIRKWFVCQECGQAQIVRTESDVD